MENVPEDVSPALADDEMEVLPGIRDINLEFTEPNNTEPNQLALDGLVTEACRSGRHYAFSKYKVPFRDWRLSVSALRVRNY